MSNDVMYVLMFAFGFVGGLLAMYMYLGSR